MRLTAAILLFLICVSISRQAIADEPVSVLDIVLPWMYPDSKMTVPQMSDGRTVDIDGKRTVPSVFCKTRMTTDDPIEKVLAFYETKLKAGKDLNPRAKGTFNDGRAVFVSDESDGRPFSIHTIIVNTATTSTSLMISRAESEEQTHIDWKHYAKDLVLAQNAVGAPVAPVQWEYKVIRAPTENGFIQSHKLEPKLNELGMEGWECLGTLSDVRKDGTYGLVILKRIKQ